MNISAKKINARVLNDVIKESAVDVVVTDCLGERFMGAGLENKRLTLYGTPGNALGTYLNGGTIVVHGNGQDAVGDTMNNGQIVIHGHAGDALGYSMRGGEIYVKGNVGTRAGVHMKEYKEQCPALIIGGEAGSFLGEYLAGGIIIVLGLEARSPLGMFTASGLHGGAIYVRSNTPPTDISSSAVVELINKDDLSPIMKYLQKYAQLFDRTIEELTSWDFYKLTPRKKNTHYSFYVSN